jgi:hypothetical protein
MCGADSILLKTAFRVAADEEEAEVDQSASCTYSVRVCAAAAGGTKQFHREHGATTTPHLRTAVPMRELTVSAMERQAWHSDSRYRIAEQGRYAAKTIIYNLNPADNEVFAHHGRYFNRRSVPGKISGQRLAGTLDQKDGMKTNQYP